MSTDIGTPPEQNVTTLLAGIMSDLQRLIEQRILLARKEVEHEFRRRATAAGVLIGGIGVLFIDAIIACLAISHLLYWLQLAADSEPARYPLWECYALVAIVLTIIGAAMVLVGRSRLEAPTEFSMFEQVPTDQ